MAHLPPLCCSQVLRILFGWFPTYRNSPLTPHFNRVLQVGDASGIQSPLRCAACCACHSTRFLLHVVAAQAYLPLQCCASLFPCFAAHSFGGLARTRGTAPRLTVCVLICLQLMCCAPASPPPPAPVQFWRIRCAHAAPGPPDGGSGRGAGGGLIGFAQPRAHQCLLARSQWGVDAAGARRGSVAVQC